MSRIVVSILAYNAEPFIQSCLASIYDIADMIIVVEGAFDRQRMYGLRSTDRTIELIKKFPDPETKIRLFHMNKQEHEHRNIALRYCTDGDWYFTVDADEIYKRKDLINLKNILSKDGKTDVFKMHWYNFYYNFKLYLKELSPPRIFRVKTGCRFIRRNTMATSNGALYDALVCRSLNQNAILIYHYGYLHNVRQKMALYGAKGRTWYNDVFMKFNWKDRGKIYAANANISGASPGIHFHGGGKLKAFKGRHPSIMTNNALAGKDLLKEFKAGVQEPFYRACNPFRYLLYGYILKS